MNTRLIRNILNIIFMLGAVVASISAATRKLALT